MPQLPLIMLRIPCQVEQATTVMLILSSDYPAPQIKETGDTVTDAACVPVLGEGGRNKHRVK